MHSSYVIPSGLLFTSIEFGKPDLVASFSVVQHHCSQPSAFFNITAANHADPTTLGVQGFQMLLTRPKKMLTSLKGMPKGWWMTLKRSSTMLQTKQQSSCPAYLSKCKALLKGRSIVHPTLQIPFKVSCPLLHSVGEMMLVCVRVCVCVRRSRYCLSAPKAHALVYCVCVFLYSRC